MIIAHMDTGHFEFVALGETEDGARKAILKGWRKHRKAYTRPGDRDCYLTPTAEVEDYYGIGFTELKAGECARDGSLI